MSERPVITIEHAGQRREFTRAELPVRVGGALDDDIRLDGVQGSLQLNLLDGIFFVQPERGARNLRIDGQHVTAPARLADRSVVALDHARLRCARAGDTLQVAVELITTGGDTAPPDLAELARSSQSADEALEIQPIAFRAPAAAGAGAPPPLRPVNFAAALGFLVLGVLAWFAFTAKSVELSVSPEPTELGLPGTIFKLQLGERFLLRSGAHRLVAELPGYYPLDTTVQVGAAPDQAFSFDLVKLPGRVTFTTAAGVPARVSSDGALLGTTPLVDFELVPGPHRLAFDADRYLPEVRDIVVVGGGERQSLEVELVPNWAPVTVRSEPPGAEVFVDGAAQGVTPAVVDMEAGVRGIELRLAGHNAWRDSIQVAANQPQTLPPVRLSVADGRVDLVSTPAEAAVSVNGQFRGRTPVTIQLSPARTHVITLAKPGYETVRRELSVGADSGRRLEVELVPQMGIIEFRTEPAGAQLWLDGELQGQTPLRLDLMAVEHAFELRLAGHAPQAEKITPRPGFPQLLDRTLEPLNALTGGGYPARIRTALGQELKLITPGEFTMGSSRREIGRRSNEVLRPVKLSQSYYLSLHEVTNAEFRAYRPDHDSGEFAGASLDEDTQPVVGVSWEDAVQFLNWLSIRDGLQPVYEERQGQWLPVRPLRNGYRLPTEAEWAWAARFAAQDAGLVYPWGEELPPPDRSGNYADLSAAKLLPTTLVTYNDGFETAAPPGSFEANAAGIFDLGGNVAEWVQDFYMIEVDGDKPLATDPLGPETGQLHVIRGSSWRSATVTDLRLASRNYGADGREDLGFRIARNLE